MTNKEAAEILQRMKSDFPLPKAAQTRRAQNDALDAAIKVLKAESCDDAISRKAAIDAMNEYFARIGKFQRGGQREKAIGLDMVGVIKNMPSVTPTKLISKISIEDEILNGIATELAKEI